MKSLKTPWPLMAAASGTVLLGLITLSSTLYGLVHLHRARIVIADAHLTVIAGISLIYLGAMLRRGKSNAWAVSLCVYLFLFVRNFRHFVFDDDITAHYIVLIALSLLLPLALFVLLLSRKDQFRTRSEPATFRVALIRTIVILAIVFVYGLVGFQLFDEHDFHEDISFAQSAHYTVDQLGLTTHDAPVAHTKRAVFFVDSLASISVASLAYVALAFFAPVKFRFYHHQHDYQTAQLLVEKYARTSEDFFKLWPRDKVYMFNAERSAMIAYKVAAGTALVVGDPIGSPSDSRKLLERFLEFCRINDWEPAFIHTEDSTKKTYQGLGLDVQKIGEEALVDINRFNQEVVRNKYFRNIKNRFTKQGYVFEIFSPPHSMDLINELRQISNDWLKLPGRAERGFMMGYFSAAYLQLCEIAVVKEPGGQIAAFLNQIPGYCKNEADFDFLRSRADSPSNVNDFLMINLLQALEQKGYKKINLGLSPLSGLDKEENKSFVGGLLRFAYENGGRFYSFDGLKRFKSKYEPDWKPRYIVYSGGLPGFGRTINSLLRAMTHHPRPRAKRR